MRNSNVQRLQDTETLEKYKALNVTVPSELMDEPLPTGAPCPPMSPHVPPCPRWSLRAACWSSVPVHVSFNSEYVTLLHYLDHKLFFCCENMAPVCLDLPDGLFFYVIWSLGICTRFHSHGRITFPKMYVHPYVQVNICVNHISRFHWKICLLLILTSSMCLIPLSTV